MRTLTRNRSLQVILLGGLLVMVSIVFEYARMSPDYRFLVDPWSLRGYETTQGWIMFFIGLAVIVLALLISYGAIKETLVSGAIAAGAITVFAAAVAGISGARDVELAGIAIWGLSLVGASAVTAIVAHRVPDSIEGLAMRGVKAAAFLISILLFGLAIIGPAFSGLRPLWLVVVVGFVLTGIGVLVRRPPELASRRLLINGSFITLIVGMTIGGSLRTALIEKQAETIGVAGDFLGAQVTSGVMLTWFGSLVMIMGSVAMWAKRREQLDAIDRARRQREAAQKSARERGEEIATLV